MIFLYVCIGIFFQQLPIIYSIESLECQGTAAKVSVTYDRNQLFAYESSTVNRLFIAWKNLSFSYVDTSTTEPVERGTFLTSVSVEGIVILQSNQIVNCTFYLGNTFQFWNKTIIGNDQEINVNALSNCTRSNLCSKIGHITLDDYTRGFEEPRSFDYLSDLYLNEILIHNNVGELYFEEKRATLAPEFDINEVPGPVIALGLTYFGSKNNEKIVFKNQSINIKEYNVSILLDGEFSLRIDEIDWKITTSVEEVKLSTKVQIDVSNLDVSLNVSLKTLFGRDNGTVKMNIDAGFETTLTVNFTESPCHFRVEDTTLNDRKIDLNIITDPIDDGFTTRFLQNTLVPLPPLLKNAASNLVNEEINGFLNNYRCDIFYEYLKLFQA